MTRKSTRRVGGAKRAAGPAKGLTRWVRCRPPDAGAALRQGGGHAEPAASNTRWLCLPYGAGALCVVVAAAVVTAITAAFAQAPGQPTDGEILALMRTHCVACHAVEPTHPAFAKAPAGVLLETIPQIAANAARIMTQVVVNRAMPLGNETGMTDEERDRIAAWIESRNK
jgi:uncharacterized membrane protein